MEQLSLNLFYETTGNPIRCWKCFSANINDRIVGTLDGGIPCEVHYDCKDCGEELAFWAYGSYDPQYAEYSESDMDNRYETQRKEFDAADNFSKNLKRLFQTPIVDDDYPEVRHEFESSLANLVRAMKDNGRFEKGNRYGLTPV